MVQYERFDIGTQAVIYVHSDAGRKIREGDGNPVEDAVFVLPDHHTYEETNEYTDAQQNAENYAAIGEMIFGGLSDVERAQDLKEVMRDAAQLLPDETALTAKELYPSWEELVSSGQLIKVNYKFTFGGKLYRTLQAHTFQRNWVPGQGTESLYAQIDETHTGSETDAIPYTGNMALEQGKYYSQNGVTYLCTRDTGSPVYHNLADLVGLYVTAV